MPLQQNTRRLFFKLAMSYGPIAFAIVLYSLTLLRGPGFAGDTAKFQFIGYVLGTPHETGYPLYMALNAAASHLIPAASLALRANILSMIFAVAALLVLGATLRRLEISPAVVAATVVAFAATPTFWSQAIIAEVYTLHALCVALTIYAYLRWHLGDGFRWFVTGCFVYSVAFGNHVTMVLLLPAIVVLTYYTNPRTFFETRAIIAVAVSVALGMAQYAYLLWRTADPSTAYLEMSAPDIGTFTAYVTGGQFKSRMFPYAWNWIAFIQIPYFVDLLVREYAILLPLVVAGMAVIPRPKIGLILLTAIVTVYSYAVGYEIPDIYVYIIPAYYCMALFLAYGAEAFLKRSRAWRSIVYTILLLGPPILVISNWSENNLSTADKSSEVTKRVMAAVGPRSITFMISYHYAMMCSYYTIGLGHEQSDSMFVLHSHNRPDLELTTITLARPIGAYLNKQEPLLLPTERKLLPPGLPVYYYEGEHIVPASRMKSIAFRNPEYFYKSVESSRNVPMRDALRLAGVRYELISEQLYRLYPAEGEKGTEIPK